MSEHTKKSLSKTRRFGRALSGRLGLKHLSYHVPEHAQSLPYMLGGLALSCFLILIVGGIYLAQFYNPNQLNSNESVVYIVSHAPFGNFVHSVHFWAANIVFILILFHMIRTFISGSYKRPREFTWLVGLGLLAVTMGYIFTGTMLSLGQEGLEALEHNSEAGLLLGKIGVWFSAGFSASLPLIGRVYIAHITILSALFLAFIVAHIYLIKVHGMSPKATKEAKVGSSKGEEQSHFDTHLKKLAGWSLILLALISLLALLRPEPVSSPGALGVEATKPPWMFLWIYGLENLFGIKALVWGSAAIFLVLASFPFIDRSPYLSPRRRWWVMLLGAATIGFVVFLSLNAWRTPISMPMEEESGYLPRTVQKVENFLFPKAYAHSMPSVTFAPLVVKPGDSLKVSGDGLKTGGDYDVFLKGPQAYVLLGTASVEMGEDMFDADFKVPTGLPGNTYTIEMHSVSNPSLIVSAPLQLTVQMTKVEAAPDMSTRTHYAIPNKETPWIIGIIAVSFLLGVIVLLK